jgi:hypothetical protein
MTFDCVAPGLASLPGTSLRASRPDVVRDDDEQAKLLCQSGFLETSRNLTYLCWVLPSINESLRLVLVAARLVLLRLLLREPALGLLGVPRLGGLAVDHEPIEWVLGMMRVTRDSWLVEDLLHFTERGGDQPCFLFG